MLAEFTNRCLARYGVHYGWVMAALVFITTMVSSSVSTVPQIIILPITREFDWQISDVSNAIGLMYVVLACFAPFASALMLKIGVRNVVLTAATMNTCGLFLITQAGHKWHLLLSIGVLMGAAAGIIGVGLAATVATRWFVRRRGLVVGVLASAFAAGQLLFVPLLAWLTTVIDWRYALVIPIIGGFFSALLFLNVQLFNVGSESKLLKGLELGCSGIITATCNVTAELSRRVYDDFFSKKDQTFNQKLCDVRSAFDKFNLISGLHSFCSQGDKIYENILPPLRILNENERKDLLNRLKSLNFTIKSRMAA